TFSPRVNGSWPEAPQAVPAAPATVATQAAVASQARLGQDVSRRILGLVSSLNSRVLAALQASRLTRREQAVPYLTDEPKIPSYQCHPLKPLARRYPEAFGQGFHPDDALARVKAVAECVERISLFKPLGRLHGPCSWLNASGRHVDPSLFYS